MISRARYRGGRQEYVLTDGKAEYPLETREHLQQGMCVRVQGEMGVGARLVVTMVDALTDDRANAVYEKVTASIVSAAVLPDSPQLVKDGITEKLWPALRKAALKVLAAKKLGRSVLLRFHGDADGIAGAFAITSVLNCKAFQHNSAMYGAKDALRDIAAIGQENRPLALLLDFGSGENCIDGLGFLKAAGIDYIVIDHHPSATKDEAVVNPFRIAENASKYTAGYLACEIAVALGLERERALQLAKTACSGDKSDILPTDENDRANALVLDFLASHVSFGNNLDFYRNVMENGELFHSIMRQADESINEAADKAVAKMKRQEEKGVEIAVFSLDGIARRGEWPPSSKITTRVFDRLRGEKPLLCVGYTERSVIMRLNDAAVALGLSANGLAERIRVSMADFVEGGGGHVKAGAIRVKRGFAKDVVNELIRETAGSVRG